MASDGELQFLLGQAADLRRAGRVAEAIAAYERLLARWPNLPDSWYNLAMLQRRARRFEAALASYDQALKRGVSGPEEVHLNRGVIFADDLSRPDEAASALEAALRLNSAYVPALLNLGNLREDLGDKIGALALYQRILAREPGHPEALSRASELQPPGGPDDPVITALRRAAAQAGLPPADRASLAFALGKALDIRGAYEAAFDAYVAANGFSRAAAPPGTGRYDRQAQERAVDAIIAAFPQAEPARETPTVQAPPIFILGMFRSGSTLVEQVLASHRRVTAGGELDLLPTMVATDLAPYPASVARLTPQRSDQLAGGYLAGVSRRFPQADLVTDKRPDNLMHVGLIKRLFPDAKIVNTRRDPLDNCLSVFFLHLDQRMAYALDLMDIGHFYRQQARLMAHWKRLYPDDILDFDYDGFVAEPRPALERLLAFCGLDWDEACLSFHKTAGPVKTASVWQVREPLYRRSSGRWRNYEGRLGALKAYLAE
jgi:tetratricopeptide (TPR) repeat protein